MKKEWKRLLIAALSSSSVFSITWVWYQATDESKTIHSTEKPLAYVGNIVDDIQRRPSSRLLWQLVTNGDALYNGEAIRTSQRGEVRIQFADSNRYLDLEPESLIVIKKSEGEIALDLLEGSLFVNAKSGKDETNSPGLVLNSTKGKVDLSQVSASLSKGKGSELNVDVLEGKASIKDATGKKKDLSNQSVIKILSPTLQKTISLDAEAPQPIAFKWSGSPPNSTVSLWQGPSRKQLAESAKASTNDSKILATLPFGRPYWKLVATSPEGKVVAESTVYRSEIVPRFAPTVIFPTADAQIPAVKLPTDLTFKWEKGEDTREMTLEVWSDPTLQQKIASKIIKTEINYQLGALNAGTYFWRLSSYFTDSDKPVLGKVQKFTVLPAQQVQAKIEPKPAPIPLKVDFTIPKDKYTQFYIDKPVLDLSWKADKPEQVQAWRLKLQQENADPASVSTIELKETNLTAPVKKPGRYLASLEAVDKNGQVLGSTTSQILTVTETPLLEPPQIVPERGILNASLDGNSKIEWNSIDGAKEYWLSLKKEGQLVQRNKYKTNNAAFSQLLPGEYDVELSVIDNYGRSGISSTFRKLKVPEKSGLRAPTIKKIQVN